MYNRIPNIPSTIHKKQDRLEEVKEKWNKNKERKLRRGREKDKKRKEIKREARATQKELKSTHTQK